jgi:YesN/AraC family two-component response regulator
MGAFKNQCEAYIVKPVDEKKLLETLVKLDLLQD